MGATQEDRVGGGVSLRGSDPHFNRATIWREKFNLNAIFSGEHPDSGLVAGDGEVDFGCIHFLEYIELRTRFLK